MHHIYMSHTIHIKPCKIKLCIESHSTGLSDRVRNTRRYAHGGYWPVGVGCVTTSSIPIDRKHSLIDPHVQLILSIVANPIRIYVSLLTTMADNRPVGVGRVTTSSIPINKKHSHIDPHVQLISSTVHTVDLLNDNRSHLPPLHTNMHMVWIQIL